MAGAVKVVDLVPENGMINGVSDYHDAGIPPMKLGESAWWESEGPVPADHDNSIINRNWFPEGFLFGSGCAAYQVEGAAQEGGRGISVWDDFALRQPWRIDDGSNGNVAADMYHRYKEDIRMMKQMGFTSFRFSISWPRILPAGRISGGVNREGIDYYNDVINTLLEYEITPFVTIFHWDLPAVLEKEYGGFLDKKIRQDYLEFAHVCFWEFGDRVKHWTTFNEPEIYALQGYVIGVFPPGREVPVQRDTDTRRGNFAATRVGNIHGDTRSGSFAATRVGNIPTPAVTPAMSFNPKLGNVFAAEDEARAAVTTTTTTTRSAGTDTFPPPRPLGQPHEVYAVARNLLLAHAEASHLYKTKFKDAQRGEIGIVLVTSHFLPYDENSEADKLACERARDFLLGWFLEPLMSGEFPASMRDRVPPENLIGFSKKEKEMLVSSLDFLGMNYYSYQYVSDFPNPIGEGYQADMEVFYESTDIHGDHLPFSYPHGIYDLLIYLNKYPTLKELYIAENGYHTATNFQLTAKMVCEDDDDRIKYHQDHLANMLKAMKEISYEVKGYFAWAWCDTYEWNSGYTMRFGLNYVDFANNYARYPKNSAAWFARFNHNEAGPPDYFRPSWVPATPLIAGKTKKKASGGEDVGITLTKGSKVVVGYV